MSCHDALELHHANRYVIIDRLLPDIQSPHTLTMAGRVTHQTTSPSSKGKVPPQKRQTQAERLGTERLAGKGISSGDFTQAWYSEFVPKGRCGRARGIFVFSPVMSMAFLEWGHAENLPSRTYSCAYCGHEIASSLGYMTSAGSLVEDPHHIYICPFCCGPTYFRPDGTRFPDIMFGQAVKFLPTGELEALYNEARTALSVNACTASVLCCKKILVYISVNKGAPPGRPFQEYIDYLNGDGYVPPDAQDWVERVQKIGGDAGHKIEQVTRRDAEVWLTLIEALLRFMYEYPTILSEHKKRFAGS